MTEGRDLSEAEREILWSVEEQGMRPRELARHTDLDESSVRTILSRARRKKA